MSDKLIELYEQNHFMLIFLILTVFGLTFCWFLGVLTND